METNTIDLTELRVKMRDIGVTQRRLADEAGMAESALSAMFHSRCYLGARRSARLQDALRRLSLEIAERKAAEAAAAQSQTSDEEQPPAKKPTPNIRRP